MKALLYLIDLNDRSSNESSTSVNRLTARKLVKQWKINQLSNSRDREPIRIPGGECFFLDVWKKVGWGCGASFPKPLPYL